MAMVAHCCYCCSIGCVVQAFGPTLTWCLTTTTRLVGAGWDPGRGHRASATDTVDTNRPWATTRPGDIGLLGLLVSFLRRVYSSGALDARATHVGLAVANMHLSGIHQGTEGSRRSGKRRRLFPAAVIYSSIVHAECTLTDAASMTITPESLRPVLTSSAPLEEHEPLTDRA
ncbi:uncharacterized protein THITE_117694 [Thermothielavioides terrestris NRRL 8126]|uniref:Secreted protein n=1 Tax=Thermothielavioides terrestris (strain ATCC 38088 / NRRL 8126) TaxID=578455 RepID=G2R7U2_THETT|nr:uncharacterized protein THITE_117694 [Thermothielavioides terrestris NRRL 8126]AEO68001.1 hypothetical protein THITE_117694 [Thermothielavioides terrestris NRRL 8126]